MTAVHIGTGLYRVIFTQDVSACSYFAQIGDVSTGTGSSGVTRVRSSVTTVDAAVVETYSISTNGSLNATDFSFHIMVAC